MNTIKSARFEGTGDNLTAHGNVRVTATMSDGTDVVVFDYYDDELSFTEKELIGKTLDQARELKQQKDIAYLRS